MKARADEQWVRLLDVDAALRARSYNAAQGAVTIAVTDPLFPANDGTWRVTAEGAIRVAAPAGATADLATAINGISAVDPGGVTWGELEAAGVVHDT